VLVANHPFVLGLYLPPVLKKSEPVNVLDRVLIHYAFCKAQRSSRELCWGIALEERRQCPRSDQTCGRTNGEND
jgi:hypothetical protein